MADGHRHEPGTCLRSFLRGCGRFEQFWCLTAQMDPSGSEHSCSPLPVEQTLPCQPDALCTLGSGIRHVYVNVIRTKLWPQCSVVRHSLKFRVLVRILR